MAGTMMDAGARAVANRYPEELEAAAQQVALRLDALGVEQADADRIGWEIAEYLRRYWGGRRQYIRAPAQRNAAQMDLLGGAAESLPQEGVLADVAEQVDERLVAAGYAHDEAAALGRAAAAHLAEFWGSGELYFCKGWLFENSLVDQEIYSRFNGHNHDWLAREYHMTVQHIYRVVKRVGAAERAKRQAVLFDQSGSNPD